MKQVFTKLAVVVALLSATVSSQFLGKNPSGLDIYKVNLNRAPQERFREVTIAYKDKANAAINFYTNFVPQPLWWVIEKSLKILWLPYLSEYFQEVEGIANYMDINLNLLIAMQFAYDLSAFCTSVVAAEEGTGRVIHSRNLDFLNPETMRDITYEAHFHKDGKFLFKATMFAALNGVMTGERPGAFSISLNSRTPSNRVNIANIILNMGAYVISAPQVTRVIRETLEQCDNYASCALPRLKTVQMMAPSYLTIAGSEPYQGAVISRDRYNAADVRELSATNWFLAQTNDDQFNGICTQRCQYVIGALEQLGQANVTTTALVGILKEYPSNNKYSIYNTIMVPSLNETASIYETSFISNDGDAQI